MQRPDVRALRVSIETEALEISAYKGQNFHQKHACQCPMLNFPDPKGQTFPFWTAYR